MSGWLSVWRDGVCGTEKGCAAMGSVQDGNTALMGVLLVCGTEKECAVMGCASWEHGR